MVKSFKIKEDKFLEVKVWGVIDRTTSKIAQSVDSTREYTLWMRVKNIYKNDWRNDPQKWDDKWWYVDISLRVVPVNDGIQIYSGAGFATKMPRFSTMIKRLGEQQYRWFPIYFKWQKPNALDVNDLKFNTGIYAHEELRIKNWSHLSP